MSNILKSISIQPLYDGYHVYFAARVLGLDKTK
jgi:hypothetical protein